MLKVFTDMGRGDPGPARCARGWGADCKQGHRWVDGAGAGRRVPGRKREVKGH